MIPFTDTEELAIQHLDHALEHSALLSIEAFTEYSTTKFHDVISDNPDVGSAIGPLSRIVANVELLMDEIMTLRAEVTAHQSAIGQLVQALTDETRSKQHTELVVQTLSQDFAIYQ